MIYRARRLQWANLNQPTAKNSSSKLSHFLKQVEKSKTQIARDLGISDSALSKWCKEFGEQGVQAFPGKGHQTPIEEENKKLKRENEILRMTFARSSLFTHSCIAGGDR